MTSLTRRRLFHGIFAFLPFLGILLAACGGGSRSVLEPSGTGARLDETHWFGTPVTIRNVTLWPIHGAAEGELGEYFSLPEAQSRGLAEVREHGAGAEGAVTGQEMQIETVQQAAEPALQTVASNSANVADEPQLGPARQLRASSNGPSVGSLVVENKSEYPILICAGTIVKGGNQDRQIGKDLVVPPKTTMAVDAFCVEQGRWTEQREGASTSGVFVALHAITPKAVRAPAVYAKDQSAVWDNVSQTNAGLGKRAATSTLLASVEDLTEEERAFRAEVCAQIEQALAGKDAVGFAYAVNGAPQAVRVFAHNGLLAQHRSSFASTVALEADVARRAEPAPARSAKLEEILALVRELEAAPEQIEATAGGSQNGLRSCDAGNASACYLEIDQGSGKKRVPISKEWMAK